MSYGLLGEHLGHSYSPMIYELLGLPEYALFPMPEQDIPAFLRSGNLKGLNVTIPYKKTVMPFCDTLSQSARRLDNVNTLLFDDEDKIHGHNTDYAGFLYMMEQAKISMKGRKVLILGSGGAAQTAHLAALDSGASSAIMISRAGENNYENIARHKDAQIIINATPVGMYPKGNEQPISLDIFDRLEGVADLIYNPLRTNLLRAATIRGIKTAGGLSMLAAQGREAAELFRSKKIPHSEVLRVCAALQGEYENIVLVGMPGSGKTTVGRLIAQSMNRKFVDIDEEVLSKTGRTAAQWIEQEGEPAFRRHESDILQAEAGERSLVIATGGGGVLKSENRAAMRRNGRVYCLQRPLHMLEREGRPLSVDIHKLYASREEFYSAAADAFIDASQTPAEIALKIEEEFYENTRTQWA